MNEIIYRATNIANGKSYIGKTVAGLDKRRRQHERNSKRAVQWAKEQ
ncbi:hypothetical protein vB_PsyM_KIL4_0093 [Pseudomonas phage vB_PsyM_KIL4]|uniref:GIY-YIG domain-containing protein n=4 Tax=Flaumdravirus TaxID=2560133 RepID=A0A142IF12_9CAUD|nr:endonuclease [Pseudomonas phage vB_PsyM_KIL1]YP_009616770.1 endonuclease [Pseudomonas phage vB_PsyM_KIL4]AMR57495.1 putative endonuclease [Pseudomonas phage vB_PsyM_KIL2]AMR57986.1 hypothetical protein vB_PsyM_KIL5_0095 [Pseudomonas phage vB_PsyM_KIL5]AMR57336.1 putative endonuclease [Pseudomonas phage vB_PsyM_KIL1]AMR57817.1 hypothetical protein vB_PsyM_KIL4_0093 [Pseudomonas phage vB_PsyM_KIL4]